jgi:hypothetical protein
MYWGYSWDYGSVGYIRGTLSVLDVFTVLEYLQHIHTLLQLTV